MFSFRVLRIALTSAVVVAAIGLLPAAAEAFTSFSAPLTGASIFATGFTPCDVGSGNAGPTGLLFDGVSFFAVDTCNQTTYRFPRTGGSVSGEASAVNGFRHDLAVSGGVYYGVDSSNTAAGGVYQFDPSTLARGRLVYGNTKLLGLAVDPVNGDLYVSGFHGIFRIKNPSGTPVVTQFSTHISDGLAFTDDGSRLYAAVYDPGSSPMVVGFNRAGAEVMTVNTGHEADGIAVAPHGVTVGGIDVSDNVFANNVDGTIVRIDTHSGDAVSVVASGGSRGDFAAVDARGCLYVTQSNHIERIKPCFFQPTPPPAGLAGYVWANDPTSPAYIPSLGYQYNSVGAINKIQRAGAGAYQVFFPGLGSKGGTVDVTGYGTSDVCKAGSWAASGSTEVVKVFCFNGNHVLADSQFTAVFTQPSSPTGRLAYLWDDIPTSSGIPSTTYQYNSARGLGSVQHTGLGKYIVNFPNQHALAGTVKVTATGSTPTACQVVSWAPAGTGESIKVDCFDPVSSKPADSPFTITFAVNNNLLGINPLQTAYLWSGDPASSYSYNSASGPITVARGATGQYIVTLGGQARKGRGDVQITPYGGTAAVCTTTSLNIVGADEQVALNCYSLSGVPADTWFTLQWATD